MKAEAEAETQAEAEVQVEVQTEKVTECTVKVEVDNAAMWDDVRVRDCAERKDEANLS